jgi:8-oxo-dGTP diphosphatase
MIQVTAAVIVNNEKVLITRQKAGIHIHGKWGFPGGKLEEDQPMVQCLKRQLLVDFGIDVEIESFICANHHQDSYGDIEIFAYKVSLLPRDWPLQDDDEIKWVSPVELPSYDFAAAYVPICKRLMENPDD